MILIFFQTSKLSHRLTFTLDGLYVCVFNRCTRIGSRAPSKPARSKDEMATQVINGVEVEPGKC